MDSIDNLRERLEALEHQTHTLARQARWWRGLACGVIVLGLLSGALPSGKTVDAQQGGVQARVAALEDKLQFVTVREDEMVITGANLRIVNGLGRTNCTEDNGDPISNCPNGLGNLIVGYNEERGGDADDRTGSHNVVVGIFLNYSRFGGIVAGRFNEILGEFASVTGGAGNTASGDFASVTGGAGNTASGDFASATGGSNNTASGLSAWVSGGSSNTASGQFSSISGGGGSNTASGFSASVSGGVLNTASGISSSVSGGFQNTASGTHASVSGGLENMASGDRSSVSGGTNRRAPEENNWRAGTFFSAN